MTSSTLLSRGTLAAILAAGCLLAPAAMADTAEGPWLRDRAASANVQVPPSPDTATEQGRRWDAAHPAAEDLANMNKKANVYVPPAQAGSPRVPVRPAHTQPVTVSGDGASTWAVVGVALGCIALLGSAGVAVMRRVRRAQRAVV
jgi:hypothetical protein